MLFFFEKSIFIYYNETRTQAHVVSVIDVVVVHVPIVEVCVPGVVRVVQRRRPTVIRTKPIHYGLKDFLLLTFDNTNFWWSNHFHYIK